LGETRTLHARHRDYYRHQAMLLHDDWAGPNQVTWSKRMHAELPNLRLAMDTCLATNARAALEMAADLLPFGFACGPVREVHRWLEAALAAAPDDASTRPRALWSYALLTAAQGDLHTAMSLAQQARTLAVQQGDEAAEAGALYTYASGRIMLGETDAVIHLCEQAHEKADRAGAVWIGLLSLVAQALAHRIRDEQDQAQATVARLKTLARAHGELVVSGYGDFVLGTLRNVQGRFAEALVCLRSALETKWHLDDMVGMALMLDTLAVAAIGDGRPALTAQVCGVADRAWDLLGAPHVGSPELTAARQACEEQTRTELGAAYDRHYLSGYGAASVHEGVAEILRVLPSPAPDGEGDGTTQRSR
jgi:hypothetical protein